MNFVKTYGLWIVLAVVTIAILVVQFVVVGGRQAAAAQKNAEVKSACESVLRLRRKIRDNDYPTRGDVERARKHLEAIQAQRVEVQKRWRTYTEGLNRFLSNGSREGGQITDPETIERDPETGAITKPGAPITWELFSPRIRDLYNKAFDELEAELRRKMEPRLAVMLQDETYASDASLLWDEAAEQAERQASDAAKVQSRILKERDELILVPVDEKFTAEEPHKGWREWRKLLLTKDILIRAVAGTEVAFERRLHAYQMPSGKVQDDEARAQRNQLREEQGEAELKDLETTTWKRPAWRFVEQVVSLEIEGPEVGNAELPPPGWSEEKEQQAPARSSNRNGRARSGSDEQEQEDPLKPQEAPEGVEAMYHDKFTVTLEIKAHPRVVLAFHHNLLSSETIWYAPLSMTFQRLPDAEVMGPAGGEERGRKWSTTNLVRALPEVAPVAMRARFSHEPPVNAVLKYEVYRFRYSDIDNYHAPAAAQRRKGERGGRSRDGYDRGRPRYGPRGGPYGEEGSY